MRSYAPEAVGDALEVALEDRLGGRSLSEAYPAAYQDTAISNGKRGDGPYWSGDHFDGNPKELARVADALKHIPADDRKIWREVTLALCDWFMGDTRGKELVDAWAGGGTFEGIAFSGCPEKFDRIAQDLLWRQFIGLAEFSVATVFHHARNLGCWNTSRARWGLGRVQRPAQELPAAARGVQAAGLQMPRQHMNLERFAWLYQVQLATKRPDWRDVAFVVAGFINEASGIAFPDFETISKALYWEPHPGRVGYQRASRAVLGLALDGFLARSPGNARGAHGRIGPSFALTLPDRMTWQEAIHAYRAIFGRKADNPNLASSDIGQCGSEADSVAATSTGQCQSMPSSDGADQHQTMTVETASGCNHHQAMRVHLSTNLQEEGAGARPGSAASSPEDPGKASEIDSVPGDTPRLTTKVEVERHGNSNSPPRSPQPEVLPLNLPAWAMELRKAADIEQYLTTPHGCLPPDVIVKLREAGAKGMGDHLAEVARKLSALRGLGLDDDQIRDQVIAARDHIFVVWSEKRVSQGKLTEEEADCIGATSMPPGALARGLGAALAKRVEWVKPDLASGKLRPGLKSDGQAPKPAGNSNRELAALCANPMWSVGKTPATNADLIDLCEEFPAMRPNRVRQHLIDAYAGLAGSTSDVIALSDLLEDTREAVRQELDKQDANKIMAEDPAQSLDCGPPNDHVDQFDDNQEPLNGSARHQ
jgi:hypothetical protein